MLEYSMYLGIHVSSSGGIQNSIENGDKYDVNAVQIMLTTPMKWVTKLVSDEDIENFVNRLEKSKIKKILIHGIYLTNLAREDKQLFHLSKMGLVVYLDFAEKVSKLIKQRNIDSEIMGICFHPGSQKELSYEDSLERISYGIQWILDQVKGNQKLLIETTAGMGNNLGKSFTELRLMRDGIKNKERVGYVLDTQHTYASGYDWVNNFDHVTEDLEKQLGIENIKSIHLNDSMVECGSNKDRHADLGEGKLGKETLKKILHYPKFKNIPFLLETPSLKEYSSTLNEVKILKELSK